MDTLDLLLHPVRLRIVHAMYGEDSRTTAQLCDRLTDVPKTTVYRHVALLAEAGVLEIVDEKQRYGAVERYFRLRRGGPTIDAELAASMSADDHRRGFTSALAVLLAEFNAYLARDDAEPVSDYVGYRQLPLWLNREELSELTGELSELLKARLRNKPAPDRSLHLVSPIMFPLRRPPEA